MHKQKGPLALSEKEEEILEFIYRNNEENLEKSVKRIKIAEILNCSPALVNKLLNNLEKKGAISHHKYGKIQLSESGLKISRILIRKHRLSEALFVNRMGIDAVDAHTYACKFEHIMDDKLTERIEKLLNNPSSCPHGNPIPSKSSHRSVAKGLPLFLFAPGDIICISQILNENIDLLKKLDQMGMQVGTKITILDKSSLDGTFLLEINGKNIPLGNDSAKSIVGFLIKNGNDTKLNDNFVNKSNQAEFKLQESE